MSEIAVERTDATTDRRLTDWAERQWRTDIQTYEDARSLVRELAPDDWTGPGSFTKLVQAVRAERCEAPLSRRFLAEAMYSLVEERELECNEYGQVRRPREMR